MKLAQDARFRREREMYQLRFTCERCAFFDPRRRRCAHGYPSEDHQTRRYEDPEALLVFCKEFELA